jgi:phage shock protein PspC (stress-responsive transcriptional regulator)
MEDQNREREEPRDESEEPRDESEGPRDESQAPRDTDEAGGRTATPGPRRLLRSRDDRLIGGVCGGLGRYFGIDPIIFRIAFVALLFAGGAGALLYLAALLFVPLEAPGDAATESVATRALASSGQNRALTVLGIVLLVIVGGPLLLGAGLLVLGGGLFLGGLAIPLAVLALLGLAVWWLVSGEAPRGNAREVVRAAVLGLGVLLICCVIAIAGGWVAAIGSGAVAAALVIGAGVMLVIGAFAGGARWLIPPALALAVSVAFVSAANIDLDGGVGEREYRPSSATDLRDRYELGMGRLVVDLRDANLPAGETPLSLRVGIGRAEVLVPRDVCVATRADIGIGGVRVFDHESGGVDVDWEDSPRSAAGSRRLVVDADVGLGALDVSHEDRDRFGGGRFFGRRDFRRSTSDDDQASGCSGGPERQ